MDLKGAVKAGVDHIMPNLLPTSVYMGGGFLGWDRPYYFHRYMSIAPVTAAYVPDGSFYSMLFLHDTSEEADVLHHAPCKFERDLYTMMMYQIKTAGGGLRPCMDGLMLCLGDGLSKNDWQWISERISVASSLQACDSLGCAVMWSDRAHDAMLEEYIKTRRFTAHKFIYELFKNGTPCGLIVRSEDLLKSDISGPLFVPNLDLCTDGEIEMIAHYDKPVVCITPAGFDLKKHGIQPDVWFKDPDSKYPMKIFAKNVVLNADFINELNALLVKDNETPELDGDPADAEEFTYSLIDTLPFAKVSAGFIKLCAALNKKICEDMSGVSASVPITAFKTGDRTYRFYVYCVFEDRYCHVFIQTKRDIERVDIITKYPVLPVRFMDELKISFQHNYKNEPDEKHAFKFNAPPGGMVVVDVTYKN